MECSFDGFPEAAQGIQAICVVFFVIAINGTVDSLILLWCRDAWLDRAALANKLAVIDTVFGTVVLTTMQFVTEVLQEADTLDS